jgi:hypothetical protein
MFDAGLSPYKLILVVLADLPQQACAVVVRSDSTVENCRILRINL